MHSAVQKQCFPIELPKECVGNFIIDVDRYSQETCEIDGIIILEDLLV